MTGIRQEGKVGEIIWGYAVLVAVIFGMIGLATLVAYLDDRGRR